MNIQLHKNATTTPGLHSGLEGFGEGIGIGAGGAEDAIRRWKAATRSKIARIPRVVCNHLE
jgi:hypothetical protein